VGAIPARGRGRGGRGRASKRGRMGDLTESHGGGEKEEEEELGGVEVKQEPGKEQEKGKLKRRTRQRRKEEEEADDEEAEEEEEEEVKEEEEEVEERQEAKVRVTGQDVVVAPQPDPIARYFAEDATGWGGEFSQGGMVGGGDIFREGESEQLDTVVVTRSEYGGRPDAQIIPNRPTSNIAEESDDLRFFLGLHKKRPDQSGGGGGMQDDLSSPSSSDGDLGPWCCNL